MGVVKEKEVRWVWFLIVNKVELRISFFAG